MMSRQLMTQTQFAAHRGVSKAAVSGYKRRELLVFSEDPNTGKPMVDVARSDARINAQVDPGRGRPPSGGGVSEELNLPPAANDGQAERARTTTTARNELLEAQLHEKRLKIAVMSGELAPVVELQRRVAEMARAARERMQSWFRGEVERFAVERDPRTIMAIGEEGIDRVFTDLAGSAAAGEFAVGEEPVPSDDELPDAADDEAEAA